MTGKLAVLFLTVVLQAHGGSFVDTAPLSASALGVAPPGAKTADDCLKEYEARDQAAAIKIRKLGNLKALQLFNLYSKLFDKCAGDEKTCDKMRFYGLTYGRLISPLPDPGNPYAPSGHEAIRDCAAPAIQTQTKECQDGLAYLTAEFARLAGFVKGYAYALLEKNNEELDACLKEVSAAKN